jgi:hypothetical protein
MAFGPAQRRGTHSAARELGGVAPVVKGVKGRRLLSSHGQVIHVVVVVVVVAILRAEYARLQELVVGVGDVSQDAAVLPRGHGHHTTAAAAAVVASLRCRSFPLLALSLLRVVGIRPVSVPRAGAAVTSTSSSPSYSTAPTVVVVVVVVVVVSVVAEAV